MPGSRRLLILIAFLYQWPVGGLPICVLLIKIGRGRTGQPIGLTADARRRSAAFLFIND